MTRVFSLVLALVILGTIAWGGVNTASAKGKHKEPINVQAVLAVADIQGLSTNEKSGWSKIETETLAGLGLINVIDGPPELVGLYLTAQQSSHEKFSSDILPFATVSKGKSKGTFYMSVYGGETKVVGKYDLKLSNTGPTAEFPAGCQILGEGKWKSKAKNSIIEGKGDITVCTNFDFGFGTFVTTVSVTGSAALVD